MAESNNQVGALAADPQPSREVGANGGHFNWLVDHCVADAQRCRPKREPLKAATDADPMVPVRFVTDKNGDAC